MATSKQPGPQTLRKRQEGHFSLATYFARVTLTQRTGSACAWPTCDSEANGAPEPHTCIEDPPGHPASAQAGTPASLTRDLVRDVGVFSPFSRTGHNRRAGGSSGYRARPPPRR